MKLKIELTNVGRSGGVFIDGAKVPNVRAVEFKAEVGEAPIAVLLVNPDVEIVTELESKGVQVRTETPRALRLDLDDAVASGRMTRQFADEFLARLRRDFEKLENRAGKIEFAP